VCAYDPFWLDFLFYFLLVVEFREKLVRIGDDGNVEEKIWVRVG
jgi:hypothetical protein